VRPRGGSRRAGAGVARLDRRLTQQQAWRRAARCCQATPHPFTLLHSPRPLPRQAGRAGPATGQAQGARPPRGHVHAVHADAGHTAGLLRAQGPQVSPRGVGGGWVGGGGVGKECSRLTSAAARPASRPQPRRRARARPRCKPPPPPCPAPQLPPPRRLHQPHPAHDQHRGVQQAQLGGGGPRGGGGGCAPRRALQTPRALPRPAPERPPRAAAPPPLAPQPRWTPTAPKPLSPPRSPRCSSSC
jgi:hypothetical protein